MIIGEFTCPPNGKIDIELRSFLDGKRVINNLVNFKIKFFGSRKTGDIVLYRTLNGNLWDYLLPFGDTGVASFSIPENKIYALYLIDSPLAGEAVSISLKISHDV